MDKVLITGGAGYLGSVLVGHLLRRNYRVTVLDNLFYGQASLLQYCREPGFDFVAGDVRDEATVAGLVKSHDILVPLAAIVGAPACARDPIMARGVNHEAVALINRVRSRSQPLVLPSSNSGYGTKSGATHCTEETPVEPITVYGVTKVEAEREVLEHGESVSLRLATVFGPSPRMRIDLLVNDFVHRAVTDGYLVIYEKDFKRNYIHVEDVAECFCFAIEHFDAMKGQAYNVGLDDANLSKAELAAKIKAQVPSLYVHYAEVGTDPDRRNYIVSNAKLRAQGFVAGRGLEQGITELLKLYRMLPRRPHANA
jgi:nucleoside-diphosphate-sugar epimerase